MKQLEGSSDQLIKLQKENSIEKTELDRQKGREPCEEAVVTDRGGKGLESDRKIRMEGGIAGVSGN